MPVFYQKKFLKFWFPVLLYSGIIFCVSAQPNLTVPLTEFFSDKIAHLAEYMILGFLCSRALASTTTVSKAQILLFTVLFCVFYGASDEFHQSFVVGRTAGLDDWLADGLGGILGAVLYSKRIH